MSRDAVITAVEQQQLKKSLPQFCVGDTIKVSLRIVEEGGKERVQALTGTCIARKGTGLSETFSIHRVAYNEGMERVFFLHSPNLVSVEVIRSGLVRRSKLYYLRGKSGKASRIKERFASPKAKKTEQKSAE